MLWAMKICMNRGLKTLLTGLSFTASSCLSFDMSDYPLLVVTDTLLPLPTEK